LHTPYRVVPRPISLLTWTRADDASSHPGRAPESTWTSTYREAEVAQGKPEAEEAQEAEDWVPPKQYWNFHYYPGAREQEHYPRPGPPCTRCGKHSGPNRRRCPAHPDRNTRNPLGTSDLGRSRTNSHQCQACRPPGRYLRPDRPDPNRRTPTQSLPTLRLLVSRWFFKLLSARGRSRKGCG
jgi:hypothetical protein